MAGILTMGLTSVRVATLICTASECRLTTGSFLPYTQVFATQDLQSAVVQDREDLAAMSEQVVLQVGDGAIALPPTRNAEPVAAEINEFLALGGKSQLNVTQSDRGWGLLVGLALCGVGIGAKTLMHRYGSQRSD